MGNERRRYFRINESVGISYQILDEEMGAAKKDTPDFLALISKQDKEIEKLILEVADESPKVSKLVALFNQKLERIVRHIAMETSLVDRIAHKVREANISACGIAFVADDYVMEGTRVRMDLTLYPEEIEVQTLGFVVGCDATEDQGKYYWRVDFYGMGERSQEKLIQHIVQSQSQQLNARWEEDE